MKKKLKKLSLNKTEICLIDDESKEKIVGGWTTSFNECTQGPEMLCCDSEYSLPKSCVPGNCETDMTCPSWVNC